MSAAKHVIGKFGGMSKMSRETGIPLTTIAYWMKEGHIPQRRWDELLRLANQRGIPLTISDLAGVEAA